MKAIKKQFLIPCYLENFRCIGSLCEDTCCKGWKVSLDKKTYKQYKKINDKNADLSLGKYIALDKERENDTSYGCINMNADGTCPFLTEDLLCKIHGELSEDLLSYTCYSYPRLVNRVNGLYEMSGTLSCPEIARLVLLDEEPMEFKDVSLMIKREYLTSITLEYTEDFDRFSNLMYHFWPLRIFTISTLQDRRYSVQERLILLGLVYKKLIQLSNNKELHKAVMTIESYKDLFNDLEKMKEVLSESKKNEEEFPFSQVFVTQFTELVGENFYTAVNYLQVVDNIADALQIHDGSFEKIKENYKLADEKYYSPYMGEREYIIENYLVNEVFKEMYPLARTESIDSSYKMLLTLYNVIKFHLVGISAYYKKLDDHTVVNTIQAFSKAILHHKSYLNIFQSE
ncbi:flagellin lysine-N-methylase [Alkaliphilus hydrothermalis]|uniref:Lysine-N-methylase n=1 Tax=Alkaliphilus hydrothermalis TaxID=1482730 RepID=A0ABS2NR10_9FIRM|nr:flagellin lysine-N-methylase [Alkaliphilus hydrothermalis]MBM7615376.1 lysine-N-methylase [Alkaliphilus hydrothermalis]